jgi:amino acid transporter
MPRAGGSYFWVRRALGDRAGFAIGWMSIYANCVASALYALGFGAFAVALLNGFGLLVPEHYALAAACVLTLLVTALQYRGAGDLRVVENTVTLLKILLLLLLALAGLAVIFGPQAPLEPFKPLLPNGWWGVVMAMAVTFVAFEGFEVITRSAEEMENPERNVPRAIFLCIALAVSLYVLIAWVLIAAVHGPGGSPAWQYLGQLGELGMVTVARQLLPMGDVVFYVAGIASTASAMIAATFSSVRVVFALGRGRHLPMIMADLHPRWHSPHYAALVSGALVLLMVLALPIAEVAGAASLMFGLLFAVVCVAAWRLRSTAPDMPRPYRAPLMAILAMVGIAAGVGVTIALFNISPLAWGLSAVWLLAGLLTYQRFKPLRQ